MATNKTAVSICGVIEKVWSLELTRMELEAIGVNLGDYKWQRLFGKCASSANYYFCQKCKRRHVAVPIGNNAFIGVDESGECDAMREFPSDDLQLYAFKKQVFFRDLQQYAFDLEEEKIEEVIPNICWRVGTFGGELKVYFIHRFHQIGMEDAIHRVIVAVQREGMPMEQFILLVLEGRSIGRETMLTVEARKGYVVSLENLLYFDNIGQLRSKKSLQTMFAKVVQFCHSNEKGSLWEKGMSAEVEVNSRWKNLHPRSRGPLPYTVLLEIDKMGTNVNDFCKKYDTEKVKIYEKLNFARKMTKDVLRKSNYEENIPPSPSRIDEDRAFPWE